MPMLKLTDLIPDPQSANRCDKDTQGKIKRHIERTKLCPPLIVRPIRGQPGKYMIMDGHYRWLILQELGWVEVECQVWDISDAEAQLMLATLNRLRGTDDHRKRAELIESLTQSFSVEDLALLIPESRNEIEDMLAMLRLEEDELTQAIDKEIQTEKDSLPIPFNFMVSVADAPSVEKALSLYQGEGQDLSQALVALCKHRLESKNGQTQVI